MHATLRKCLTFLSLALIWGGALAVSGRFTNPGVLKAPLMTLGLAGLAVLSLRNLKPTAALIPFLLYWMLGYFRLTRTAAFQDTAVLQVGMLMAFLAGYLRAPLAHRSWLPLVALLCVARGLIDVVTLTHLGGSPALAVPGIPVPYSVVSFFLDKNLFGGMLILAAFHHFYLMEKGDPHRPVQVLLYSSSLLVLLSILLVDSRAVQGAFFLCFLPLLFLSVRLDGREPRLERLAWITGITLSLGIAWINLPEMQLRKMGSVLSQGSLAMLTWTWSAAARAFAAAPWLGHGIGGFRFSVLPFEGAWPARDGNALPALAHADNHFLESLVDGGVLLAGCEMLLIAGAVAGFARVYFTRWRLEAKYAFFAMAALLLLALVTPVLELAPARLALWCLIGYGWSLLAEWAPWAGTPGPLVGTPRTLSRTAQAMAGGGMIAVVALHLGMRVQELRSDHVFASALAIFDINPRGFTDSVATALHIDPTNEEANYAYLIALEEFHRESQAVSLIHNIQRFAPDPPREAEALARVYSDMGRDDSAAFYATRLLQGYPKYLPALEILMRSFKRRGLCASVDSLRAATTAWGETFPIPDSREYTMDNMDSLFHSNHEVIFLQRWFGGKAMRQRFVQRRLDAYNQSAQCNIRLRSLQEARCGRSEPEDSAAAPKNAPKRRRPFLRGWG